MFYLTFTILISVYTAVISHEGHD